MNKKVYLKLMAIVLFLVGSLASCGDKEDKYYNEKPRSIKDIVDVFELKYGDVYEGNYNGQTFKFSITDVEDNLCNCTYLDGFSEMLEKIRIHAFLKVENNGKTFIQKVSSKICGPNIKYDNYGTDFIQQTMDLLNYLQSNHHFSGMFYWQFGETALIENTSFGICMAKADPTKFEMNTTPPTDMYKFIFIITKK